MFRVYDSKEGEFLPTIHPIKARVVDLAILLNKEAKEPFRFVVMEKD